MKEKLRGSALILSFSALRDALRRRRREEAVQGAGMVGPFQAQGATESDASDAAEAMSRSAAWFVVPMALPFAASDCP